MSPTFQPTSQDGLPTIMGLNPSAPSKTVALVRVGLVQGGTAMMLQKSTKQVKFASVVEIAETNGKEAPNKTATSNRVSKPVKTHESTRQSIPVRTAILPPAPTPTTSPAPSQESGLCVVEEDDTPSKMAELEIVVNHTRLPAILKAIAARSVAAEALRLTEAKEVAVLAAEQAAEEASSSVTDKSLTVVSEEDYGDEEEEEEQMPRIMSCSDRPEDVQTNSAALAMEYAAAHGRGSNTRENVHFTQFARRKPFSMLGNFLKITTTFLDINTLVDCPRLGVTPHDRMELRFNHLQRQATRVERMSKDDITELVHMKRKAAEKKEEQNILKCSREKDMLLKQKKRVSLWKPYGLHISNITKFNKLGAGIGICRDIDSPTQSIRRVDSGISGFSDSEDSIKSKTTEDNTTSTENDIPDSEDSQPPRTWLNGTQVEMCTRALSCTKSTYSRSISAATSKKESKAEAEVNVKSESPNEVRAAVKPTYNWYDNLDGYQKPNLPSTNNDKAVAPEEKSNLAPLEGMVIGEDGVAITYEALMNEEVARENIKAYLAGYYIR